MVGEAPTGRWENLSAKLCVSLPWHTGEMCALVYELSLEESRKKTP